MSNNWQKFWEEVGIIRELDDAWEKRTNRFKGMSDEEIDRYIGDIRHKRNHHIMKQMKENGEL